MFNRCHLARLVVEERDQHEKIDNPGEVIEGKGDQKPEDEKKGKGSPNENESKPRASKTISKHLQNILQIPPTISKYIKRYQCFGKLHRLIIDEHF